MSDKPVPYEQMLAHQVQRDLEDMMVRDPAESAQVVPMGHSKLGRLGSFAKLQVLTFTNDEDFEESLRRDQEAPIPR